MENGLAKILTDVLVVTLILTPSLIYLVVPVMMAFTMSLRMAPSLTFSVDDFLGGWMPSFCVDDGLKSIPWIRDIVDRSDSPIRFIETVATFDPTSIPCFMDCLHVSCPAVSYSVTIMIFRNSLEIPAIKFYR